MVIKRAVSVTCDAKKVEPTNQRGTEECITNEWNWIGINQNQQKTKQSTAEREK